MSWRTFITTICLLGISSTSCMPQTKTPLIVFAAGSLINPFSQLEKAFEASHPNIDVQAQYHGSIQVIRHSTDLHEPIDVIATADENLIPSLMYQTVNPQTNQAYANWYLSFATNSLGIAYTPKSKFADEITPSNWADILTRPEVKVGLADPRFDASGYRTLMVYKLAEEVLGEPDLFGQMFSDEFRFPISVDEGGGLSIIRVPEILETNQNSHIVIRGASVQLLALLESGDLDYAFEYESVIKQHNLNCIHLPDTLNLGDRSLESQYSKVSVLLDFQRFSKVKPEFSGGQIRYAATIPSNAPHPADAEEFLKFIFSPVGQEILEQNYQPVIQPPQANSPQNLPTGLFDLVEQK